ncbi:MAG: ADP-ribosylation factor-like protein [Candidatus Hydrothermarchaeota archaeon]
MRIGIRALDERIGDLPRPCSLLLYSDGPAEKTLFAEQFIAEGVKNNEPSIYLDFYRWPNRVKENFERFGVKITDSLLVIDCLSPRMQQPSQEKYAVDPSDPSELLSTLSEIVSKNENGRIVFNSLEFFIDLDIDLDEFIQLANKVAKDRGFSPIYKFSNWSLNQNDMNRIKKFFDGVIEFKSFYKGGIRFDMFRIEQTDLIPGTSWIPYILKEKYGLVPYIPKILVTGPYHSGKSTFIRALCPNSISIDRMGTTIAFDHGYTEISEIEAEIFGTPGQERFEFIFNIFAKDISGIVLVVDSTDPESFERAKEMIKLAEEDKPLVIAANKQDLPNALSIEEITERIGLDVPVIGTVATQAKGVEEVLQRLVHEIMKID